MVVIGGKPESTFEDPIGLLGDCHRRIERFLAVLSQIAAAARGERLSDAQRSAWSTSLRYFREAAPKHTADEEESLFPRLRTMEHPGANALLERVDALETEHAEADRYHGEVDRLGTLWLETGTLDPEQTTRLLALLDRLSDLYRRHIALEDGEVFPMAANLLSSMDRTAIGAEMASRRGIEPLFRNPTEALAG